jgi:hypothetical protein
MATIIVSGALANKPGNGGAAWTRLSWALGCRQLGHDVYFVEQIAPEHCIDSAGRPAAFEYSANATFFADAIDAVGLRGRAALVCEQGNRSIGLAWADVAAVARDADLLVNISGHLTLGDLKDGVRQRAFVDLDPGYTQFWAAQGLATERIRGHEWYFTVGENIGSAACRIPTGGLAWRPIRQPVVLDEWPVTPIAGDLRFTTVASWRGAFGRVTHEQGPFGLKAHEFRKFIDMPGRTGGRFEIALDIHSSDHRDVSRLTESGWNVVNPQEAAVGPAGFRRYVQQSGAEFSVAQGIYVETHSGWFSDRTVRYLASGKPALVQDTGFSTRYPTGLGLVAFSTIDEAVAGARAIAGDYGAHAAAARAIAEEHFAADRVLSPMLDLVGIGRGQ